MYRYKDKLMPNDLLDGRAITYIEKDIPTSREHISLILRGKELCSYNKAKALVSRCKPGESIEKYFEKIESEV